MAQLTPEELQSVKELQQKYNQTVFEIGAVEAQIIAFNKRIESMTKEKNNLVNDLMTIEQKESELTTTLQEKYGTGNINPETGEITPIQQ